MKRQVFFIITLFFYCISYAQVDSLLTVLEQEISRIDQYDAAKQARIAQLKNFAADTGISSLERYKIYDRLIEEYQPYKFEEALNYSNHNISLATKTDNVPLINKAKLHLADLLSSSGNYTEAKDILAQIDKASLDEELTTRYYYLQMWLYYRLRFYSPDTGIKSNYSKKYEAFTDTLLQRVQSGSELYLSVTEMQYRDAGKKEDTRRENFRRLTMARPGTRVYSSATFFLAQSYLPEDIASYKKYLILSAISDIKASVKDNASLTALAVQLFKENDVERAHSYINHAFDDAAFFNSRLRLASLSNILPIINKAYEQDVQQQKEKLQIYLTVISVLSLLLLLLLYFIRKQVKKVSAARKNLQGANNRLQELNGELKATNSELKVLYGELYEINRVKEYYIGTLLNLCSEYLDKLDVYRKTVKKMIVGRQVNELLEKTKSGQFIDDEINLFYKNFDSIFLHIYPDFVEQLNDMLMPEEQIILKKGELLNTELRIFALIRLGITDSSKIAKLLRYSVNTIYNYRVKVKNKAAVSRDDFEKLVMKIGSYSTEPLP